MAAVTALPHRDDRPQIAVTPHLGEMAHLCHADKDALACHPAQAATRAAAAWQAVVALKGATTCIATPNARLWRHTGGNVGLATSGSGDVLAGLILGLAARGAPLEQAVAWGVAVHALAGEWLAARVGPLGYLAREIPGEFPALLLHLAGQESDTTGTSLASEFPRARRPAERHPA
jgi:NAD(P)H-hydrate repair Nnr-like enzyme with NAD(P)H-hydrate dehydratase domain